MTNTNGEFQNRPKPFSKERTRQTLGMIIYFYCVFFVMMKVIAVVQGAVVGPNLLIAIPFVGFAIWGFYQQRHHNFSWFYIIIGILMISALRYYETGLLQYLQDAI